MNALGSILLVVPTLVLAGCQATSASSSQQPRALVDQAGAKQVARDMMPHLQATFIPANTTFVLSATENTIAGALEGELRRRGYGIASRMDEPAATALNCTADWLGDSELRVTLAAAGGFVASRIYELADDGELEPGSAIARRLERADPPRRRRSHLLTRALGPADSDRANRSVVTHTAPQPEARPDAAVTKAAPKAAPPAIEPPVSATGVAVEAVSRPAPVTPSAPDGDLVVLVPNAEHVVEISGALAPARDSPVPNPFLQQYVPRTAAHELSLAIGGVALGPHPAVVLNERVCSLGESVDGFRVADVDAEAIQLQRENIVIRIPKEEGRILIRYP